MAGGPVYEMQTHGVLALAEEMGRDAAAIPTAMPPVELRMPPTENHFDVQRSVDEFTAAHNRLNGQVAETLRLAAERLTTTALGVVEQDATAPFIPMPPAVR